MINRIFMTFLLLLGLAGCQSAQILKPSDNVAPDLSEKPYEIGVSDTLSIMVWRNPDLSMAVPVRPDGFISVPLIGDIKAAGMQPEALAEQIRDQIKNFVRTPQVTVIVTSPSSSEFLHRIRITGAVGSPSSQPYRKGMTVMDLVLGAGGVTEFGDSNAAKLYRLVDGKQKIYGVRLDDILEKGNLETNYYLHPGDILTVPERLF